MQNEQTVIVTGASKGLGAAIAQALDALGARLVLTARDADALKAVAAPLRAAKTVVGDITQPQTIAQVVETAHTHYGQINAVVNNAGVLVPFARVADANPQDWQHIFDVNFFAPMMLIQAALPALRAQRGRVINVSSGVAVRGDEGWGAYGASKAALNHLTMTVSAEERDVTVVAVRPGNVDTQMQAQIRADGANVVAQARYEHFMRQYQAGELLPPEQPARAIAVLALAAPPDWSGNFMSWDDEYIRRLSERYAGHPEE